MACFSRVAVVALLVVWVWLWLRRSAREEQRDRVERAAGTFAQRFVVVEDDGSARELNFLEAKHLNQEYDPQDMAKPWFKSRYDSRSRMGAQGGYLARSRLPPGVPVQPRESDEAARERAFQGDLAYYRSLGATLTETATGDIEITSDPSARITFQGEPDGQPGFLLVRCPANWRKLDAP